MNMIFFLNMNIFIKIRLLSLEFDCNSKWYSVVDLCSACYSLPVHENTQVCLHSHIVEINIGS